ncbi:unnamed protein product [Schistosoma guineensis]|nr:unnamed protein product [Schistosoma guineensis]
MIIVVNRIIKAPVILTESFANVTEASDVQWYEYCRGICVIKMTSLQESFGGVGRIVEIDETVVRKRKFNRERIIKEVWLSSTSINIPRRSLEFTTGQPKRNTSEGLETDRQRQ